MRRIITILPDAPADGDSVRLDHDLRNRRRMVFRTAAGDAILLDMARTVHLRDGDGLELEDGSIVRVEAAAEALIEITAPDLPALVRIAWHLGDHMVLANAKADHVIAEMVAGLGGVCEGIMTPFDPEGGAYALSERSAILAHHHHHDHHHG
jgi:urease accessory protein